MAMQKTPEKAERPAKTKSAAPANVVSESERAALARRAGEVASLLKTLAHRHRLLIACQLMEGEQSVSAIEAATGVRQPVLSRELARLRAEGLIAARRQSRSIHYRLADARLSTLVTALCAAFAPPAKRARQSKGAARRAPRTRRPT